MVKHKVSFEIDKKVALVMLTFLKNFKSSTKTINVSLYFVLAYASTPKISKEGSVLQ